MKIYCLVFQEHLTSVNHYMKIVENLDVIEEFLKENRNQLEKDDGFTYLEIWKNGNMRNRERKV